MAETVDLLIDVCRALRPDDLLAMAQTELVSVHGLIGGLCRADRENIRWDASLKMQSNGRRAKNAPACAENKMAVGKGSRQERIRVPQEEPLIRKLLWMLTAPILQVRKIWVVHLTILLVGSTLVA